MNGAGNSHALERCGYRHVVHRLAAFLTGKYQLRIQPSHHFQHSDCKCAHSGADGKPVSYAAAAVIFRPPKRDRKTGNQDLRLSFEPAVTRSVPVAIVMAGGYAGVEDVVDIHAATVAAALESFATRGNAPVALR